MQPPRRARGATSFTPGVARISVDCVQPIGRPCASAMARIAVAPLGNVRWRARTVSAMPRRPSTFAKWIPAVALAGSGK
jgi:hypothetical protein